MLTGAETIDGGWSARSPTVQVGPIVVAGGCIRVYSRSLLPESA
jgi:hypothetical protein